MSNSKGKQLPVMVNFFHTLGPRTPCHDSGENFSSVGRGDASGGVRGNG
jgi:hypothetical protein